jgi:hypothetical protein
MVARPSLFPSPSFARLLGLCILRVPYHIICALDAPLSLRSLGSLGLVVLESEKARRTCSSGGHVTTLKTKPHDIYR